MTGTSFYYLTPIFQLLHTWPDGSLLTLLKAAMAAAVLPAVRNPTHNSTRLSLAVAAAVERRLSDATAAASYEQHLDALQAGVPAERRLALSELRQHCLLAHLRAAMQLADLDEGEAAPPGQVANHFAEHFEVLLTAEALGPASPQEARSLALASARKLLRRCPSHPRPAVLMADLRLSSGDLDAAMQHLRLAVQLAQGADRPFWLARAGHPLASLKALSRIACMNSSSIKEIDMLKQEASLANYRVNDCSPACMRCTSNRCSMHRLAACRRMLPSGCAASSCLRWCGHCWSQPSSGQKLTLRVLTQLHRWPRR